MSENEKWKREAGVFNAFLQAVPDFAGRKITNWKHSGNQSPDIICVDRAGARIGVEMTEWLHEDQTRDFSRWERVLRNVEFPLNWTIDIYLDPFGRDCAPADRARLVDEISGTIREEISRPRVWDSGLLSFTVTGVARADRAPILAKYCNVVAGHSPGSGRLLLQGGGAFSPTDAEQALRTVIAKKVNNESYRKLKGQLQLRSLYLLVYYDVAILKNTPNLAGC